MARTFCLPAVGDTMVDAEIVDWLVEVGDEIALDQPICSIETDKSVVEMTTPYRGVVLALGGEPGDVVAVGEPLITVGEPGEELPAAVAEKPPVTEAATAATIEPGSPATEAIPATATEPVRAMPRVRRLARERAVDLTTVTGTGPHGAVTVADLDAATSDSDSELGVATAAGALESALDVATAAGAFESALDIATAAGAASVSGRRERLSAVRRSIARHLTESSRQIPQFTSLVELDTTALLATRAALAQRLDSPVPLDALLTALLVPVLQDHPVMNAMLDGDEIVYFDRCDIGIAVDAPDGLTVPVVRAVNSLSVGQIATEILRLATAARDRTIQPSELAGATATVNNVGPLGLIAGTPILPLGTSMIAAFGKARPMVQLRQGSPVEVPIMTVSATFDHRIVDGGAAGRFLAQLKDHLEVPALGLLT